MKVLMSYCNDSVEKYRSRKDEEKGMVLRGIYKLGIFGYAEKGLRPMSRYSTGTTMLLVSL